MSHNNDDDTNVIAKCFSMWFYHWCYLCTHRRTKIFSSCFYLNGIKCHVCSAPILLTKSNELFFFLRFGGRIRLAVRLMSKNFQEKHICKIVFVMENVPEDFRKTSPKLCALSVYICRNIHFFRK